MAHTPGPWKAVGTYVEVDGGRLVAKAITMKQPSLVKEQTEEQTARSNALILAAAPKMLEALRLAWPWLEGEARKHARNGEPNEAEYMGNIADAARRAIAAAEGK